MARRTYLTRFATTVLPGNSPLGFIVSRISSPIDLPLVAECHAAVRAYFHDKRNAVT